MILYENLLMTMDYDPTTDILAVDWPNLEPYSNEQVAQTLEKLIEMLRNYDVKNLLVDSSNTRIAVNDEDYKTITDKFIADLVQTRLHKFARVKTSDTVRETRVEEMSKNNALTIKFRNFANKAEAMVWLKNKDPETAE